MVNKYGIFFTYGGRTLRLPINPAELPQSFQSENSDYNVLGVGPITVPRTPKQREISISSFFPGRNTAQVLSFTPTGFLEPEIYIDFFQKAMEEKRVLTYTPVRYMEDGTPFATSDVGFDCIVQSFNVSEKGGETGDFYYDLTIREYRDYSPQMVKVKESTSQQTVVTQTPARVIPPAQIVVGSTVIANGNFYYTSYGEEPHGVASGRRCKVSRIVDESRKTPVLITTESGGLLGWIAKSALRVVE